MQAITIEKVGSSFRVKQGDKMSDRLMFEEMIGQVINLAHPSLGNPLFDWDKGTRMT
jgi:hypothetical protein